MPVAQLVELRRGRLRGILDARTGCGWWFESARVHGGYSSMVERRIVAADTPDRYRVVTRGRNAFLPSRAVGSNPGRLQQPGDDLMV